MTEARRTTLFVAVALALIALAWATGPRQRTPAALQDRGQPFFPDFTDPNAATSLEVIEFDEETSAARPFKVQNRDGRWTIPSRENYPADGGRRLATVAAAIIGLRKDDVASDNVGDQEACGVLDPLDETLPTPKGRGTRITVKGRNDRTLADIITGRPVEGRPAFRYVRVPGQKRTYVARVGDLSVSTKFEDWIERNLLVVNRAEIDQVAIRNYSADATSGRITPRDMIALRKETENVWHADGMRPGESMNTFNMNLLITKLVDLAIVDVRPKPPGVTATLSRPDGGVRLSRPDVVELAGKGFYFTADGRLLSDEGEVLVHTSTGIFYILRFGEVAHGNDGARAGALPANRYLFISVGFDPGATGGTMPDDVRARLEVLRARFAPWYYVVSDDSVQKIRLTRAALVTPPKSGAARP